MQKHQDLLSLEMLERTDDDGRAIREANAVINHIQEKRSDPFREGN